MVQLRLVQSALLMIVSFTPVVVTDAAELFPQRATADSRTTADFVSGSLVAVCSSASARPRNETEWKKLVAELGLKQRGPDSPWSLVATDGEVRAIPIFSAGETTYWVMYFPANSEPLPEPILSHFMKDARHVSVDGGNLEIGLPPIEHLAGGGTKAKNITVSIAGGRLLATRTRIEWK
jgi:hypothetical protein